MSQIFPASANSLARASIVGIVLVVCGALTGVAVFQRSSYATGVGVPIAQPIMFSHKHTPVEVVGLHWHLVDVIGGFLSPLFYLMG